MKTFILGTSVKITSILNVATATSAVITIEDSSRSDKVTEANMYQDADNVYYYILQTLESWTSGTYVVTVKITYGGYDSLQEMRFNMVDPFDPVD